jgi:hypothetical protein
MNHHVPREGKSMFQVWLIMAREWHTHPTLCPNLSVKDGPCLDHYGLNNGPHAIHYGPVNYVQWSKMDHYGSILDYMCLIMFQLLYYVWSIHRPLWSKDELYDLYCGPMTLLL